MREISWKEAEKTFGQRLDRRRKYAVTNDMKPDVYTCAVLHEFGSYVVSCSGCYETVDGHPIWPVSYDKNGVALGGGCDECGYHGKVRHTDWYPVDLAETEEGEG